MLGGALFGMMGGVEAEDVSGVGQVGRGEESVGVAARALRVGVVARQAGEFARIGRKHVPRRPPAGAHLHIDIHA